MTDNAQGYASFQRGEEWSEWLLQHELTVLNESSEAFIFYSSNGASDIDVTMGNYALARSFDLSWQLKDDLALSDHNPIFIGVRKRSESIVPVVELVNRWVTANVDWVFYS